MIIAVSGVDCAGKSTQIELLKQYFVSRGMSCTIFWYRPGYSREFQMVKDFSRKCLASLKALRTAPKAEGKGQNSAGKQKVPAPLWIVSALFDSAVQWGLRLRMLERKYDVVICDRYVRDGCLDLIFKYPDYVWSESIFKTISLAFPKPDVSFLLWLPYETVLERASIKQEPFPDDPHIRELRWHAYEYQVKLSELEGITVIDAAASIEQTHDQMIEAIKKAMPASAPQ